MKISMHKLNILLNKEFKDILRNNTIIFMAILPIGMTFLYQFMFNAQIEYDEYMPEMAMFVLIFATSMALAMIPGSALPTIIAEEKEKNTLRTLILSDVNGGEFLLSKTITILVVLFAVLSAIFFIAGVDVSHLPMFLLTCLLAAISLSLIGALIGLISKNQMSAGMIASPVMMVLMLLPMLRMFDPVLERIAFFFPTTSIAIVLETLMFYGNDWSIILPNYAVLGGWIIGAITIFILFYNRLSRDN